MWRPVHAVLLAAALALTACSTGWFGNSGRIDYGWVDVAYSRRDFAYAGGGRDMRTEILGNPFQNVAQADFDAAVTTAMEGAHFGPATHFTTTPDDTARPAYRVRLVWNGPQGANGYMLCGNRPIAGGGSENGTARVAAAFCRSDRALTYAVGSIDGVTGPDDPRFVRFVRRVAMRLFPPRDGDFDSNDCTMPGC